MKKSELKVLIRNVINETVQESMGMNESVPPHFPSSLKNRLLSQYKDNPEKAYATMWSIHNKKDTEGYHRVNELLAAWNARAMKEDTDPDSEERREYDKKISRYNNKNSTRYPCPTCKTPDALTAWEKQKGYQCSSCADAEEGLFEQAHHHLKPGEAAVLALVDNNVFPYSSEELEKICSAHHVDARVIGDAAFGTDALKAYRVILSGPSGQLDALVHKLAEERGIEFCDLPKQVHEGKIQLSSLVSEMVAFTERRQGHRGVDGEGILPLRGLVDIEIPVEYTIDIYKGTTPNMGDDPDDAEILTLEALQELKVSDISEPSAEEIKVIQQYQSAVNRLVPGTSSEILIPVGLNILALSHAMNGWLDEAINQLTEEAYSKHHDYNPRDDRADDYRDDVSEQGNV